MKFADMINEVVPEADELVPNPIIKRCLREAVISFCRATWAWRYKATVTIDAGDTSAALTLPEEPLCVACAIVRWEADRSCTKPNVLNGTEVSIEEDLDEDLELELTIALQPSNEALEYPDWMDGLYRQAIVAHAKHSILMQRGRLAPLDMQRAQVLYSQYTDTVNSVRREQNPMYVGGNLRIRARR